MSAQDRRAAADEFRRLLSSRPDSEPARLAANLHTFDIASSTDTDLDTGRTVLRLMLDGEVELASILGIGTDAVDRLLPPAQRLHDPLYALAIDLDEEQVRALADAIERAW
ncbi:hypothetical protein OG410_41685 [Streptomyces sp. NBC_00659]|uniref:hypothetical protein n=1 Tax=Streptomyces sp. NBC_00659 TaxID=2903669 RepID=UPI002E350A7C|nr:hypothetical protein [Streptomyces sp. NBC_00659]